MSNQLQHITPQPRIYPKRVSIKRENKVSMCALDQIRTIDKRRVVSIKEEINSTKKNQVKQVIQEMLVD